MKSLAETNSFLLDRQAAEAFLLKSIYGSSLFEGAKGLRLQANRSQERRAGPMAPRPDATQGIPPRHLLERGRGGEVGTELR